MGKAIAAISFILLLVSTIAAVAVVPDVRYWLGLEKRPERKVEKQEPPKTIPKDVEHWKMREGNWPETDWIVDYDGTFACNVPGGPTATCTATRSLHRVHIKRFESSDNNLCDFDGDITGDSISGTYKCLNGKYSWKATIIPQEK